MNPPLSPGALAEICVIDCSRVLGGPYCTAILADFGAEVIKIEPPAGDETRDWGPPFADGTASYFLGVNRGKRGLALDLSCPEGRDVLLRLLAGADVLVENFKPGTMEKWGIGAEVLSARFPRLVYCRISGFGADGPMGGLPGYDAIVQAMSGLMSINGSPETGPLRIGAPLVDIGTGLFSAIGILTALFERGRSGRGQFLDMTLYDCALALLHPQAANYFLDGKRPRLLGNVHPNIAPYETFSTATGTIFLCVGNDGQFRRLCAELGAVDLAADPRFLTNAARLAHRAKLCEILAALLGREDGKFLCERLLRAGVPAGPVLAVDEALKAEHTKARGMVVEVEGWRGLNTPIRLSHTPGGPRRPPPEFNADGAEILRERGFSEKEISALAESGVLPTNRRR